MKGKGAEMLAKHLEMMDEEGYEGEEEGGEEAGELELKLKFKSAAEARDFLMKGFGSAGKPSRR
jgi:hypothetical protein